MRSAGIIAAGILTAVFASWMLAEPASGADQWRDTLHQTSELLRKGKFSDARDRLSRLVRNMADEITTPSEADRLFALALAQLAVAEVRDLIDYICSVAIQQDVFFLWRPQLKDPGDDLVA